jgi:hypothetical protein
METRSWWGIGGIVQELVRPLGIDLRVIIAGGRIVGAAARTAAPGDVDLLPDGDSWIVLEVNGAVYLRPMYSLDPDVYSATLRSLHRTAEEHLLLA